MRIITRLALTILISPAMLLAQAPAAPAAQTFSQKMKAGAPEVERLIQAFELREALPKAEALLPIEKPAYDASSANAVHTSCWAYIELGQAYMLAFRAAEGAGQWEKALGFITKAVEIAKENQTAGKAELTKQVQYWAGRAAAVKARIDLNADAIKELKAKATLEDYEVQSMEVVKVWDKELADGEKWSKFFQYDMDRAKADGEYYEKVVANIDKRIKSQQEEIEAYKGGDKHKWVEAVVATSKYMDSIPDKADKIALAYRLTVIDPENHKAENTLQVLLGKAAPEKDKPAPARKGKKG